MDMDTNAFSSKLWGDVYYHSTTRCEPQAGVQHWAQAACVCRRMLFLSSKVCQRPGQQEVLNFRRRTGACAPWCCASTGCVSLSTLLCVSGGQIRPGVCLAAFKRRPPESGGERSFVQFILEPLYKLYSQIIGEHRKAVEATLAQLGVTLKPSGAAHSLAGQLRPPPSRGIISHSCSS